MKTILVVDDEYALVDALAELLAGEGWTVAAASDGREGLAVLRAQPLPPSLCLVDVMMPFMGGYEFLRVVREDPALSEVPVVLMSAAARSAEALRAGATAFLRKPFRIDELLALLAALARDPRSRVGP